MPQKKCHSDKISNKIILKNKLFEIDFERNISVKIFIEEQRLARDLMANVICEGHLRQFNCKNDQYLLTG